MTSGKVQMLGVNLGSWLVLEQYMVPHIFALVKGSPYGERQLMQARTALLPERLRPGAVGPLHSLTCSGGAALQMYKVATRPRQPVIGTSAFLCEPQRLVALPDLFRCFVRLFVARPSHAFADMRVLAALQFAANQSKTDIVRAAIQEHRQIWVMNLACSN